MPAIGQKGEQAQQRSCLVPRGQPRSNVPRSQSSTAHRPQWRFPFLGRTSPGLVLRRSGRLAPAYPRWLRLPAPRSKTARSLSSPFAHKGRLDSLEGLRGALASACPQPAVERPTFVSSPSASDVCAGPIGRPHPRLPLVLSSSMHTRAPSTPCRATAALAAASSSRV